MLFSWDWISYQESMALDMEGTLISSLLHTQWTLFFCTLLMRVEDFPRHDHPTVAFQTPEAGLGGGPMVSPSAKQEQESEC